MTRPRLDSVKPYEIVLSHERVAPNHEIGVNIMKVFVNQFFQMYQTLNIKKAIQFINIIRSKSMKFLIIN